MLSLPLDTLRALTVIHETGSFTAAAERLGRTQPAISQQVKKLEGLLERSLFNREGARLALTPDGETLLHYARQMLALNDEALGQFSSPAISGRIRLGIPSEFATTLLPQIVSRFARAYPEVTLEVTCDLSRHLVSAQQSEHYDLILALHDRLSPQQRRRMAHFIKFDELVWVSSAGSRAHLQDTLPLVAAPSGCRYRARALRVLGEAKRSCRITYTIPDLTGLQAAIVEGLGVTVLARSTVPAALTILEPSAELPALGSIGISLKPLEGASNPAVGKLVEFIEAGLE